MHRIALVGNGRTTKDSAGFDGEIWTTASVSKILPKVDRIFEVHDKYDASRLNSLNCPVMMDGAHKDIQICEDLEIDSLVNRFGPVFQFSFDYMMAYAILKDVSEIWLYGIDLTTDTEYADFRQSFFYWVGMARGMGIAVNVSEGSLIFNRRWVYCHERDPVSDVAERLIAAADEHLEQFKKDEDEARLHVAFSNGYKQCAQDIKRIGV